MNELISSGVAKNPDVRSPYMPAPTMASFHAWLSNCQLSFSASIKGQ